jgi:hypothetical protein
MARHWNYTIIIVPAAFRAQANGAAASMGDDVLDSNSFAQPYGASAAGPVTHYACCVTLSDVHRQSVEGLKASFPGSIVIDYVPGTQSPPALIAAQGLVPVTA